MEKTGSIPDRTATATVVAIGAGRIGEVQQGARDDGKSLLIIDGAPHADAAATPIEVLSEHDDLRGLLHTVRKRLSA